MTREREELLEEVICDKLMELSKIKKEYAESLMRHGEFCAQVTLAAFGHSNALTHDQIIDSLRELRREARR